MILQALYFSPAFWLVLNNFSSLCSTEVITQLTFSPKALLNVMPFKIEINSNSQHQMTSKSASILTGTYDYGSTDTYVLTIIMFQPCV